MIFYSRGCLMKWFGYGCGRNCMDDLIMEVVGHYMDELLMEVVLNRSSCMKIKHCKFIWVWTVLHNFSLDVGSVFPNNSISHLSSYVQQVLPEIWFGLVTQHITQYFHYRVMWKTLLQSWIPLGLHLDQSKYMGWALHITRYVYYRVKLQITQTLLFDR